MSGAHTPGPLTYRAHWSDNGQWEICADPKGVSLATTNNWNETDEANARRLVARWNACEGMPIEDIEQIAANHHRLKAETCSSLASLLRTIDREPNEPMPVEGLAQALLKLDLCIVHKAVIKQAHDYIGNIDDAEGLGYDDHHALVRRLALALEGKAE